MGRCGCVKRAGRPACPAERKRDPFLPADRARPSQGGKRGYAFQVRRFFRIFCLLLATAVTLGVWIGVTTILGRASITERYAPDNELAIRVKGCDVRVIKSTVNKVELNRWRGSGMTQR